jgi:hypothetical protein
MACMWHTTEYFKSKYTCNINKFTRCSEFISVLNEEYYNLLNPLPALRAITLNMNQRHRTPQIRHFRHTQTNSSSSLTIGKIQRHIRTWVSPHNQPARQTASHVTYPQRWQAPTDAPLHRTNRQRVEESASYPSNHEISACALRIWARHDPRCLN